MAEPRFDQFERLKREHGDAYVSLLAENGKGSSYNGFWEARARLAEIERELKNGRATTQKRQSEADA